MSFRCAPIPAIRRTTIGRLKSTQTGHDPLGLFNYLVGAGEDRRRDSEAERPSSLQDAVDIALTDGPALEKALAGVQSVFVVTGHNPDMAEQQNNVLDAALKVGTEYLVRVSGARTAAKADSESVVGRSHAAINERLKASNIK